MLHYTDLAFRYIKMKKSRSVLTVIGVSISVMLLYMLLNLGWSYILNERADIRKNHDYEIVLFTESKEQIEKISNDKLVKDMTVGEYYREDYYNPVEYNNAMYINTTNPYRMNDILSSLTSKYGVEGSLNDELAQLYLQGAEGELLRVLILVYFLIAYIFAVFGVGIIKNSVQLTMFEQVKDFGNLRCIGSTKKQLQHVIFIEGLILEFLGIAVGVVSGSVGSLIGGVLLGMKNTGFHILPVFFVVAAFLFDLYFTMYENSKMVTEMSPVSAIRGEYRISLKKRKHAGKEKQKKVKERKAGLIGRTLVKIFGVEGDYAYKNLMRSPGRFIKVVTAMSFGIAAVIILSCGALMLIRYDKKIKSFYGYYPIYLSWQADMGNDWSDVAAEVPYTRLKESIKNVDAITDAKRILSDEVFVEDYDTDILPYVTDEYMNKSYDAMFREKWVTQLEEDKSNGYEDGVAFGRSALMGMEKVCITGYDEQDMKRCGKELTAGTLDVSEDGIIAVENAYMQIYGISEDGYLEGANAIEYTKIFKCRIGDKIRLIDMAEYRNRLSKAIPDDVKEEYKKKQQECDELYRTNDGLPMQWEESARNREKELSDYLRDYRTYVKNIQADILDDMRKENQYKTYTIEGIIRVNPNRLEVENGSLQFVVPASHFYKVTGREDEYFSGMMYHFAPFSLREYEKGDWNVMDEVNGLSWYDTSGYPGWEYDKQNMRNYIIGIALAVMFIISVIIINYYNNMASNMHMRRQEFAQLRVIGVSKRRLFKMVMLEGIVASAISCLLGVIFGAGLSYALVTGVISKLYYVDYVFPLIPALLSVVITIMILCVSVYFPLKRMGNDVAEDLATAGE